MTTSSNRLEGKMCIHCKRFRPLAEFLRRTGRRAGSASRRGTCRECRKQLKSTGSAAAEPTLPSEPSLPPVRRRHRPSLPPPPPRPGGPDESVLRPTRQGIIRMRGKTDKGRGWYQETDLETASALVRERAAVVVNPHTIRRLYSNKNFRQYILKRDKHTCFYCGEYGDTIDHLLPRAKGGHTTPMNCVCACSLCNQSKADLDMDEFIQSLDAGSVVPAAGPEGQGPRKRSRSP